MFYRVVLRSLSGRPSFLDFVIWLPQIQENRLAEGSKRSGKVREL